ncbi:MAG: BrnA antitoxin family protein [Rhodobacter sp.]|nr:BrnA antitoxin family protein [Rhodobacter sp.]
MGSAQHHRADRAHPREWHEIKAPPAPEQEKVTLRLEKDVLRFFRQMGVGYAGRINDVLKSYMYARLTGLLRGAETTDHFRQREVHHAGPKPGFEGEDPEGWRSDRGLRQAKMQELMQRNHAADGLPGRHRARAARCGDWRRISAPLAARGEESRASRRRAAGAVRPVAAAQVGPQPEPEM